GVRGGIGGRAGTGRHAGLCAGRPARDPRCLPGEGRRLFGGERRRGPRRRVSSGHGGAARTMSTARVALVGDAGAARGGGHLMTAATELGVTLEVCDSRAAYRGGSVQRRVLWRLAGRRPARLAAFSADVLAHARRMRADVLLTTGLAPIDEPTLRAIGKDGI